MRNIDAGKARIAKTVEELQERFWKISDAIWSYAELGLEEFKSSRLMADTLESAGFKVERKLAGMPTCFVATWRHGKGKPVIGFLAEYDALPMLSQKPAFPKKEPVVKGAPGHGCGHNTMGPMQALSVISLQKIMKEQGIHGTLKFFGSPAEEMLVSRPYMIRAGLFKDLAAVIDCHPWRLFKVHHGVEGLALFSFIVTFRGKTAHSGVDPWKGRSAVDALELMHAGTERLREHLPVTHRIHWVTLEGGEAPNVVPDRASTWYFIRDLDENIESDYRWVIDCAKGAALMTQTKYEVKVLAAGHQRFQNKALAELLYNNMQIVGKPKYTKKEERFARELQKNAGFPVKGLDYPLEIGPSETVFGGSSDVGDVTLVAPTTGLRFPAYVPGCTSHHWTVAASVSSSIAHKGITAGAKTAAFTAYDLLTQPTALAKIREEFKVLSRQRPYRSFLPRGAKPPLGWNAALMEKYSKEMEKFYLEEGI